LAGGNAEHLAENMGAGALVQRTGLAALGDGVQTE
jgi:hypothetical protein